VRLSVTLSVSFALPAPLAPASVFACVLMKVSRSAPSLKLDYEPRGISAAPPERLTGRGLSLRAVR